MSDDVSTELAQLVYMTLGIIFLMLGGLSAVITCELNRRPSLQKRLSKASDTLLNVVLWIAGINTTGLVFLFGSLLGTEQGQAMLNPFLQQSEGLPSYHYVLISLAVGLSGVVVAVLSTMFASDGRIRHWAEVSLFVTAFSTSFVLFPTWLLLLIDIAELASPG